MASASSSSSTCDCSAAAANEPVVDTRTSNALCPNRPPPRVAICVVGGARTFPQEQAWRSLKRNLIEGFGGIGLDSPSPDVFMHLKLVDDAPKEQREWRFDPLTRRQHDVKLQRLVPTEEESDHLNNDTRLCCCYCCLCY